MFENVALNVTAWYATQNFSHHVKAPVREGRGIRAFAMVCMMT